MLFEEFWLFIDLNWLLINMEFELFEYWLMGDLYVFVFLIVGLVIWLLIDLIFLYFCRGVLFFIDKLLFYCYFFLLFCFFYYY